MTLQKVLQLLALLLVVGAAFLLMAGAAGLNPLWLGLGAILLVIVSLLM